MKSKRTRYIAGSIAISILTTAAMFGLGEALLRGIWALRNARVEAIALPYIIGDNYGPVPPWADAFRMLERDRALLWRNRPDLRQRYVDVFSPVPTEADRFALLRRFSPSLPDFLRHKPTWNIALNSQGFRAPEFEVPKPRGRVRIVCLGDSWTFGSNVNQDQAYPQRLQALLRRAFPTADIEVLNLGVFGYTSFQGLALLRRQVLVLDPDVVVLGFGMNDSSTAGFRDEDLAREASSWAKDLAGRSAIVRLLRYEVLSARHKQQLLGEHLKAADARAADPRTGREHYASGEAWTRVPLEQYERNLTEMIAVARARGAAVILLFNEIWGDSPYREMEERVANAAGIPFIDSQDLIARARRAMEIRLERARGLTPTPEGRGPANGGAVEVVFRVTANDQPVPKALFIVGADPALGGLVPNKVSLYDDGTHGDQRAGDGVWSYAVALPPGKRLAYVYTNSGREGRWEGLDVPALRTVVVDDHAGRRMYRPIESFGRFYFQADAWHTDADGYDLIAHSVSDALVNGRVLQDRLQRQSREPRG